LSSQILFYFLNFPSQITNASSAPVFEDVDARKSSN